MSFKQAFQFNAAGILIGETEADESPLEPGVFLLPANCTFDAPPADVPAGQCARWNGTSWALANAPEPPKDAVGPVEKLQAFLLANPEVAAMLGSEV